MSKTIKKNKNFKTKKNTKRQKHKNLKHLKTKNTKNTKKNTSCNKFRKINKKKYNHKKKKQIQKGGVMRQNYSSDNPVGVCDQQTLNHIFDPEYRRNPVILHTGNVHIIQYLLKLYFVYLYNQQQRPITDRKFSKITIDQNNGIFDLLNLKFFSNGGYGVTVTTEDDDNNIVKILFPYTAYLGCKKDEIVSNPATLNTRKEISREIFNFTEYASSKSCFINQMNQFFCLNPYTDNDVRINETINGNIPNYINSISDDILSPTQKYILTDEYYRINAHFNNDPTYPLSSSYSIIILEKGELDLEKYFNSFKEDGQRRDDTVYSTLYAIRSLYAPAMEVYRIEDLKNLFNPGNKTADEKNALNVFLRSIQLFILELLLGVYFFDKKNVYHNDYKIDNLIVTKLKQFNTRNNNFAQRCVQLIDFGLVYPYGQHVRVNGNIGQYIPSQVAGETRPFDTIQSIFAVYKLLIKIGINIQFINKCIDITTDLLHYTLDQTSFNVIKELFILLSQNPPDLGAYTMDSILENLINKDDILYNIPGFSAFDFNTFLTKIRELSEPHYANDNLPNFLIDRINNL